MSVSGQQPEHRGPEHSLLSLRSVLIQMIANGTALASAATCRDVLHQVYAVADVRASPTVAAVLVGGTVWWRVTSALDRRLRR